jgi:hypothetical protein
MNMIPLHHIGKPNYLVIQFNQYKNILMLENYCSDPDCNCDEVLINFAQLDEKHKITNNLLNLRVELDTGRILEKTILEPAIDADSIIFEFNQHFQQFKAHLNDNNQRVKAYFSSYHGTQLPQEIVDLVNGGNCVDYQKIFGNINQLSFNLNDETYIIEDQYCMNPTCLCDEVIIIIYKPNSVLSEVVLRLDLSDDSYDVLKFNNKDHIDLINHVIKDKKSVLESRYHRVKAVGNKFLLIEKR